MKKRQQRLITISIILVVSLLVIGGSFVLWRNRKHNNIATVQPVNNDTVNHPVDDTNLPRKSATATPTTGNTNPAKPTLNKSSGNGADHLVPAGTLMNFTCTSTIDTSCDVVFTSKTDISNIIMLGIKNMSTDHGQLPYASWDWTSITGEWSIVARAKNSSGLSTDSNSQDLKVQ